jgi:hypothetical protein
MEHERGAFKMIRARGVIPVIRNHNASNLDNVTPSPNEAPDCRESIQFFRLKFGQKTPLRAEKLDIIKQIQQLISFIRRGTVLAIPLTQGAVGPFRSFSLRQGDYSI